MLKTQFIFYPFILLLFCLSSCRSTSSFQETSTYFILEDSSLTLSAAEAWSLYKQDKFQKNETHSINPGFTKSFFWLVVQVDSSASENHQLQVGTAQINNLEFYTIINDKPFLKISTGDHQPYESRPQPSVDFVFPLLKDQTQYLVKIDKRNESLQLTFNVKPTAQLWDEMNESSMVIGILSGVIILMMVFGIYLSIITKEKIYIFYTIYVLCGWLYVISNLGFGFKYLWPHSPWFASRARPVFALLTVALSIQFIEYYTGPAYYKLQQRLLQVVTYIGYLVAFIFLLPIGEKNANGFGYFLQAIVPVAVALFISLAIITLIQKAYHRNTMAMFYLSAIALLMALSTLQLLHYSGGVDISGTFFENYGQALGYVSEAVILTFGLTYRFNTYRYEREQILITLNQQQEKYTKAIITTQENERMQIADQLHDVAGSLLSAAKLHLSSVREKNIITNADAQLKLGHAEDAITTIADILRNLSHAISPVMLDKVGFKQAVEKIVSLFNNTGKLSVELVIIGFEQEEAHMRQKYSILYGILYELMNNIVKHAHATHTLIQLIEHDDTIVMMVEDNGKGIDESVASASQGLTAIQSKIHYLQGSIYFDQAEPQGLIVTIEIPKG